MKEESGPKKKRLIYSDGSDGRGGDVLKAVVVDEELNDPDPFFVTIRSGRLILRIGKRFVNRIESWVQVPRDAHEDQVVRLLEEFPLLGDYEISRKCDATVQTVREIRRKMREDSKR